MGSASDGMTSFEVAEYWRTNRKLRHLTPPGERWPEVGLFDLLQSVCVPRVLEFGCGDGRLAEAFAPEDYIGVDLNPYALSEAQRRHERHYFRPLGFPKAQTILAHTVLLHVPDSDIEPLMARFSLYPVVVIGEMMGRHWRRPDQVDPPVFNREPEEYVAMLDREMEVHRLAYPRYDDYLTVLVG